MAGTSAEQARFLRRSCPVFVPDNVRSAPTRILSPPRSRSGSVRVGERPIDLDADPHRPRDEVLEDRAHLGFPAGLKTPDGVKAATGEGPPELDGERVDLALQRVREVAAVGVVVVRTGGRTVELP